VAVLIWYPMIDYQNGETDPLALALITFALPASLLVGAGVVLEKLVAHRKTEPSPSSSAARARSGWT